MSLEICIIVDDRITVSKFDGKADTIKRVEGSSPERDKARVQDTTGVEERGMYSQG